MTNFFEFIANEVREYLAQLGFRSLQEAVGRVEMLNAKHAVDHWKARGLDISPILAVPQNPYNQTPYHSTQQDHGLSAAIDNDLIAKCESALEKSQPVSIDYPINNTNRAVGTMLGYQVTKRFGETGLPDATISIRFTGSAGQSFGAFIPKGIELRLEGDSNDYLGKGLSGGRIILHPDNRAKFVAHENVIAGNVIGYGATSGEIFIAGIVGERFCVRNSGATAVVEGLGDHGCEYMTGGTVLVLGKTGRNFAAGMSGGIAYVYDEDGQFASRCNTAMVSMEAVLSNKEQELQIDKAVWHRGQSDEAQLRKLLEDHNRWTGSKRARELLDQWDGARSKFVKVFPLEYKRALGEIHAKKSAATSTVSKPKTKSGAAV